MGNNLYHTDNNKAPAHTSHESAKGVRINSGPFIGIVKNNTDPSRSGKLQVWIAELGGKEDDTGSWRTVGYSTPFYGVTPQEVRGKGQDFAGSPHSYGMWFVPPDLGVKVLCTFVNGDPFKGYWFACIPEWPNMHMVPGLSAPVSKRGAFPVVDYNDQDPASSGTVNQFFARAATPHTVQQQIYTKQGLISDPLRGPGTSSAFRETPSRVFGISTPGVPLSENDPDIVSKDTGSVEDVVRGRKGGHTFVMDDGDAQGKNRQFKMRSSTGHTILMSDTGGFIYIINAAGTAWIEMDAQGAVNVYSGAQIQLSANSGINIDSKGAVKIHGKSVDIKSDGNVNIEGKDVNVKASGSAKVSGGKDVSLKGKKAYLTGDECASVSGGTHVDIGAACVKLGTSASKATAAGGATAPQNMPTKEPWSGHKGGASGATQPTAQPSYASTSGLPGGSGTYGASNNFGSSNIQQNYAELPNDIGPVKYTTGFQGSTTGQASMFTTSVNSPESIVANTVGNVVGNAVANSIFDVKTTDYKTIPATANFAYLPGATYNATYNLQGGSVDTSDWTPTEKLNNPGRLEYEKTDARAIGNSDGYAVYNKPEDGIAQLVVRIQSYLNEPSLGSSDKNLQTVMAKLLKTDPYSGEIYYAVRTISSMTGISGNAFLNMTDPRNCISVTTAIIQFSQKNRIIYTYEQMVTGCAMGLGVSPATFANSLTGGPTTTSNGYGSPGTSTYVPVTTAALVNGSGSAATQILTSIGAGVVTNVVSKLVSGGIQSLSDGINNVSAAVTSSNSIASVVTDAGSIVSGAGATFSGGTASLANTVTNATQNFNVNDISNIVGRPSIGGTTECVGIATGVFGWQAVGNAANWRGTGTGIVDSQGAVPIGTAAATFNFDGIYGPPGKADGAHGQSHTLIVTGYVDANRQPFPQDAYKDDGTLKDEYRGQVRGFIAAEQSNSTPVIRSRIYMDSDPGAMRNANRYQPIIANGKQLTGKILPNQQPVGQTPQAQDPYLQQVIAQGKNTTTTGNEDPNKTRTIGPEQYGPPAPDAATLAKMQAEAATASKTEEAKTVGETPAATTGTSGSAEAGTTVAQPTTISSTAQTTSESGVAMGTELGKTQAQADALSYKIGLNSADSELAGIKQEANNIMIETREKDLQDLSKLQTIVAEKQQEIQKNYDNKTITEEEYLGQKQYYDRKAEEYSQEQKTITAETNKLHAENAELQNKKDSLDAQIEADQDKLTELRTTETLQARGLDQAETDMQTSRMPDKTESSVGGGNEFPTNYSGPPANNTPESNTGSGTVGGESSETAISSRDNQTSIMTEQTNSGTSGQDADMQGAVFAKPDPTEGNDMKGATFDQPESRTITTTDDQGNTMTFKTGEPYGNAPPTENSPYGSDNTDSRFAETNDIGRGGAPVATTAGNSTTPVTGASGAPGTGTAAANGAQTTPQGAANTGGGALKC